MRPFMLIVTNVWLLLLTAANVFAADNPMTAGDLQEICLAADPESKAGCRFFILGMVQGIDVGMAVADGKTRGGRPCVPEDATASALELAVKMKMGQQLMVFPDDRKLYASGVVAAAIIATFPCKKSK